jgi:hypothetical protein
MGDAMFRIIPSIAVRRLPVVFWSSFYVDPTNHGLRRSIPSNPVDPIQPRNEKEQLSIPL